MVLAVPTQDTFSVGEILTAALMNKNVRDAVNFLSNPPIFLGKQTTAQSIPSGAFTPINWDAEDVDSYGGHSNTTAPAKYVAQVAGWYFVSGRVTWSGNATGTRSVQATVNGNGIRNSENDPPGGNVVTNILAPDLIYLSVGDYVQLSGIQTSGGSLSTNATGWNSHLLLMWVHA
jgi:hypothetical protein